MQASIGLIFNGDNPLILRGSADAQNTLEDSFIIGNSGQSTETTIFTFHIIGAESEKYEANILNINEINGTHLAPGETVKVTIQVKTPQPLPVGVYNFTIVCRGMSEFVPEEENPGVVEHTEHVCILMLSEIPQQKYSITVFVEPPVVNCPFTIDGIECGLTPKGVYGFSPGEHTITVVVPNGYIFDHWEDGSESNTRTIYLTEDTTFTAYLMLSPPKNRCWLWILITGLVVVIVSVACIVRRKR